MHAIKRANQAFNTGNRAAALADFAQNVEWRDLAHPPDVPELVRGLAAVKALIAQWDDALADTTAQVEEYIDAGNAVVTVTRWSAQGKDSGVTVQEHSVEVYEFSDGQIVPLTVGGCGMVARAAPGTPRAEVPA